MRVGLRNTFQKPVSSAVGKKKKIVHNGICLIFLIQICLIASKDFFSNVVILKQSE